MDTRFSVFVFGIIAVAAVFFAGISSSPVAFAVGACWVITSSEHWCTSSVSQKWYVCILDKKTGNRPCKEMTFAVSPDSLPPELQNSLDAAIAESQNNDKKPDSLPPELRNSLDAAIAESQNNDTKPKTGILDDGGLLKGQGDNQNQTTSKTIVPTQDRFCLEGTGGTTGKPCIPCDPTQPTPGMGTNCPIISGGGEIMPDTATPESGKSNDTKAPKDLGGLNGDENGPEINPGSD